MISVEIEGKVYELQGKYEDEVAVDGNQMNVWELPIYLELQRHTQRPYDGQDHTDQGERGRQIVEGATMRDIGDCLMLAYFQASGLPESDWPPRVYDLPLDVWSRMDPVAIRQSMLCNLEKLLGIYPNYGRRREEPEVKATADE